MENDKPDATEPNSAPSSNRSLLADSASSSPQFRLPGWSKVALLFTVIALASVGYFTGILQKRPPSQPIAVETDPDEVAKRQPLQDFILTDAEGKQQKLSDFRGNVVILSFWASWCAPCLVELPTFAEIEKRLHSRGLRILAINVDEGNEGKTFAKDFWAKKQFKFPSFFDAAKSIAQIFEVEMLPSNFVIDRQGRLAFSGFGANDWASQQTVEFLEGLLQEPAKEPAPPATTPAAP